MSDVKISKRLCAYLLDIIFIYLVVSLVSSIRFINPKYEKYEEAYQSYSEVLEDYYNGDLDEEEMLKLNTDNYYNVSKYSISYSIATIVIIILYFVIFQKFNNGQTIGKQIMKLKVVTLDDKSASIFKYLIRCLFMFYIYVGSIIPLIINDVLLFLIDSKYYLMTSSAISYVFLLFSIANFITMNIRKDKRGIHELITKTKVINA